MAIKPGTLFVISAPTGGGKTTLANALINNFKNKNFLPKLLKVVTCTTRPARSGEINGLDYNFLTEEDFLHKKDTNFFLETTTYDGFCYGSPRSVIDDLNSGNSYVLVTDRPGAILIKHIFPPAVLIWIDVPDINAIFQRLTSRGTENPEIFQRRLAIATQEIQEEREHPVFTHHILNNDFNQAAENLCNLVSDTLEAR